ELGAIHWVVGLLRVAARLGRPLVLGEAGLEREDRVGLGLCIGNAGQLLDIDDIGAVGLADRLVLLAWQQIIVAARQAQARLAGHHGVAGRILLIGRNADADRAGIAVVGHQQFQRAAIV